MLDDMLSKARGASRAEGALPTRIFVPESRVLFLSLFLGKNPEKMPIGMAKICSFYDFEMQTHDKSWLRWEQWSYLYMAAIATDRGSETWAYPTDTTMFFFWGPLCRGIFAAWMAVKVKVSQRHCTIAMPRRILPSLDVVVALPAQVVSRSSRV